MLRVLTALAKDLGSVWSPEPTWQLVIVCNSLPEDLMSSSGFFVYLHTHDVHVHEALPYKSIKSKSVSKGTLGSLEACAQHPGIVITLLPVSFLLPPPPPF